MRVLIVGASGGTGRQLVLQALERGHDVTALVRKTSRLRIQHAKLRVCVGNVLMTSSLAPAVSGQDAVLCALGHKRWLYPNRILSDGTRNLIEAMSACGVRRLVCETALGFGDTWWRGGLYYTLFVHPIILPFYFHDKGRQETVVRNSDLDWTLVRPGALTNGRRRSVYQHGPKVGHWLWTVRISRADVAAFMLDQLHSTEYLRAAVGLAY